jgi:hypothetical protein
MFPGEGYLPNTLEPFDGYYTVPRLLERNARELSNSPAYREKSMEYGKLGVGSKLKKKSPPSTWSSFVGYSVWR